MRIILIWHCSMLFAASKKIGLYLFQEKKKILFVLPLHALDISFPPVHCRRWGKYIGCMEKLKAYWYPLDDWIEDLLTCIFVGFHLVKSTKKEKKILAAFGITRFQKQQ